MVTETFPVAAAPTGTAAKTCVAEIMVKGAATPLMVTAVAPARLVPVMVTVAPGPPEAVMALIVGLAAVAVTVKLVALVAVAVGVITLIRPVVAPAGTPNTSEVALTALKVGTATPFRVTEVAPSRLVPVTVTVAPGPPEAVIAEIVGVATVNALTTPLTPVGVVTVTLPAVMPAGTSAEMLVALITENAVAGTPLKLTAVAPVKFVPVMVTAVPTGKTVGDSAVTVGRARV